MDEAQKQAEETAQEIEEEHKERLSPFTFSKCNIHAGEYISWGDDPDLLRCFWEKAAVPASPAPAISNTRANG